MGIILDIKSFIFGLFFGVGLSCAVYYFVYANRESAYDEIRHMVRNLINEIKDSK